MQDLFNAHSKCEHCEKEKACIYLKKKTLQEEGCQMSEKFYVKCVSCQKIFKSFYTSKTTNKNLIDINLHSVYAAVTSGGGLTLLRSFCSSIDLPPPVHTVGTLFKIFKSDFEICCRNL